MKEHDKKLLEEKEKLRFHCDSCRKEWTEDRPQNHWIRSGKGTNYYIHAGNEEGPHIPIRCPYCYKSDMIRRISPPLRPSTINTSMDTKKAMLKWASNPITREEELGDIL
jgi:hypothetical protein